MVRRLHGERHESTLGYRYLLVQNLVTQGKFADAKAEAAGLRQLAERQLGPDSYVVHGLNKPEMRDGLA